MQFKKVNFKKLKLSGDDKVSKTYIRDVENGSRLASFVGNEPLGENKHCREPIHDDTKNIVVGAPLDRTNE